MLGVLSRYAPQDNCKNNKIRKKERKNKEIIEAISCIITPLVLLLLTYHVSMFASPYMYHRYQCLTLALPGPSAGVSGSLDSYCSLKPLCSSMGEVVPARTSPTLLPPSPRTVLSLSCFKVSQCINCHDWHCKS